MVECRRGWWLVGWLVLMALETALVLLAGLLLLGSLPPTVAQALGGHATAHRNILRASSKYIKRVYEMRWTNGHMHSGADGD